MRTTWAAALAWRLGRHHLGATRAAPVEDVVDRLVAVPAWSGDPDLAVGVRLGRSAPGSVGAATAAALTDGRLVRVYAFRGATHLMTPRQAADHLALRAAGRMWERPSWVEHYRLRAQDWPELRAGVREALAAGPLTFPELGDAVAADPRWAHLRQSLSSPGTLIKAFFWQGDVCFGPQVGGSPTLAGLGSVPHWPGMPDLDVAGRRAVTTYLSAYGPATPAHLHRWLGEGLGAGRRRIERWLTDLADELVLVDVDDQRVLMVAEHVEALGRTDATPSVRLLAGHDQWVLGVGTADPRVVPPEHRREVTRGANLLLVAGVVSGTWVVRDGVLTVTPWASSRGPGPDDGDLAVQVARIGELLGHARQAPA